MRVAIITGASRGLGEALARRLATDDWALVLDARGAPALDKVAAELSGTTPVTAIAGDVTDAQHRSELIAAADRLGSLELLVNNAGILGPSPQPPLDSYPLDVFEDVHRANVSAPLALIQLALPALSASDGAVVNITSDAAVEPYEGWGGYASAKAALEQLSAILAVERPDVRVWWVDPGDLRTQMHQEAFPGEDISDRTDPTDVAPAFARLITTRPASGRHKLSEWEGPSGADAGADLGAGADAGVVS
ncbi:MAG: SDR family oxidoreductase [Actinomycetota bacterium]|nr:SDR family oxidoreductase [Actinomycetota bacterium]